MNGFRYMFPRSWKITSAIAGSMLIVSAQASFANQNDQLSFREFKALNPDVARHAARQMFRSERRQNRVGDAARLRIQPIIDLPNAVPAANTVSAQVHEHRAHNIRLTRDLTRNRTTQVADNGQTIQLSSGVDLDLSSNQRNIALGKNLFSDGGSVEITVGGESKTLGAGSMVSAAEYVAVKQALGGGQTVTIDRSGRATGGNVDLESIASDRAVLRASELVIPENVTTSGDFSRHSDFRLIGDLNNYGTLHATSSDGSPRSGAIRAVDINNYRGAIIRSDISSLTLDASGDINNLGNIEGIGAITLSAAGTVNNNGTARATNDLSIQASRVNNSGLIESTGGNINLNGPSSAALVISNTHATLQALNGAINLRDSSYNGTFNSIIVGGDLFSKEVNLFAGQANADLNVGQLTGTVNQSGLAAHVVADTEVLNMGSVCLTGDPTIYNLGGSINIDADVLVAENLVYVATGDITTADNITIQAGDINRGYEINMIAGANFVEDHGGGGGAGVGTIAGTGAGAKITGEDCGCGDIGIQAIGGVRLNAKPSKTGGQILFGNNVVLSSRPTTLSGDKNGDGILLAAFKGKGTTSGSVNLAGATVVTGGTGTGTNGDFYVLAENTKGTAITSGIVDTTGGSGKVFGKSGTVGLFTVNLISSQKGQDIVYDAFGQRTSSAFLTGEALNKTGDIIVSDTASSVDILANDRLIVNAGSAITVNGQAEAIGSAELISNGDLLDGPNANFKSALNIFLIAINIGASDNPITVEAPDVESYGTNLKAATSNFVEVLGTGVLSISGNSKGTLVFDAPTRDIIVPSFGFLTGKNITVNSKSFGTLNNVNGSNSVSVSTDTGNFLPSTFANLSTKILNLSSNSGSIGTPGGTFFTAPAGITTISAKTTSGVINLRNTTGDSLTFTQLEATAGSIAIQGQNSITLAPTVTAGTTINITTTAGTITASGAIKANDGITLSNTSDSGKISIAKNTTIDTNSETAGLGDILLSVGVDTATPAVLPIANVEINDGVDTGVVVLTGAGVTGKSPVNKLNAPETADLRINNGTTKAANISLGGNVIITAQ